jgi:hypothetical protein
VAGRWAWETHIQGLLGLNCGEQQFIGRVLTGVCTALGSVPGVAKTKPDKSTET